MIERLWTDDDVARWEAAVALWRSALATVPRHKFIPDTVWIKNPRRWPTLVPLCRDDDPDRWLRLTYAASYDDYVVTQVDDGHPDGPGLGGSMPTSSASSPVIVAVMLAALDASLGHRVLEIGTGTGYNAALLAHRLGTGHVTSIEIDPDVAAQARTALSDTGYGEICVITGDGALRVPTRCPVRPDRRYCGCAQHPVPVGGADPSWRPDPAALGQQLHRRAGGVDRWRARHRPRRHHRRVIVHVAASPAGTARTRGRCGGRRRGPR
jgi:protein-L-isoaspartate O-methyltransferase